METAAAPKHELELRAEAGSLTKEDRKLILHAKALRDGMRAGKSVIQIATALGQPRLAMSRYLDSTKYHAALRAAAIVPAERTLTEEEAIEAARKHLANQLPEAAAFIDSCFARDETKAERPYLDPGNAQWATQVLLKAAGIGEKGAVGASAPVMITAEAMCVMLGAIRGDDSQRERKALPTPSVTVTVEPRAVQS